MVSIINSLVILQSEVDLQASLKGNQKSKANDKVAFVEANEVDGVMFYQPAAETHEVVEVI